MCQSLTSYVISRQAETGSARRKGRLAFVAASTGRSISSAHGQSEEREAAARERRRSNEARARLRARRNTGKPARPDLMRWRNADGITRAQPEMQRHGAAASRRRALTGGSPCGRENRREGPAAWERGRIDYDRYGRRRSRRPATEMRPKRAGWTLQTNKIVSIGSSPGTVHGREFVGNRKRPARLEHGVGLGGARRRARPRADAECYREASKLRTGRGQRPRRCRRRRTPAS